MKPWEDFLDARRSNPAGLPPDTVAGADQINAQVEESAIAAAREIDAGFPYTDSERHLFLAGVRLGASAMVRLLSERGALPEMDGAS